MLARVTAFVAWAAVAAVIVFWALKLLVRAPMAPGFTVPVSEATAVRGDLSRLLGRTASALPAAAAAPELASRFKLLGVMAPKLAGGESASTAGLALIAVDGKPARAFAPGARIDGELVLQSVSLRTAAIGPSQGDAALTLEVPRLQAAATGTLPPVQSNLGAPPPPARPAPQLPIPVPPPPGAAPAPAPGAPPNAVPAQAPGFPTLPRTTREGTTVTE
jgi:general secretion pathway protein C